MIFDGDPVNKDDRMFSDDFGPVRVVRVTDDSIMVEYVSARGGKQRLTFNPRGVAPGQTRKTLWWYNPRVVTPRKDPVVWSAQAALLQQMTKMLGDHMGSVIPYDEYAADPVVDSITGWSERGLLSIDDALKLAKHFKSLDPEV